MIDVVQSEDDLKADARQDFVKRLFAVTLSVGFASQISRFLFTSATVVNHKLDVLPLRAQWREILLLVISLVIVVTSWEGYLLAIKRLPLKDSGRFYVDIALVFSYLLLMLAAQTYDAWFSIHLLIFAEYLFWDYLRTRLPSYKSGQIAKPQTRAERSMSITIVWLVFFLGLFALKETFAAFDDSLGFLLISLTALVGVLLYRQDKRRRWGWGPKAVAFMLPFIPLIFVLYFHLRFESHL